METSELRRSTLQRKDRDELHTIAVAMGGKPGSRARKAEIVDMILDLAGVTDGANGNGDASAPSDAGDERAASSADRGGDAASDAKTDAKSGDRADDQADGTAEDEPGDQPADQADSKSGAKADDQADAKSGDKSGDRADAKSGDKTDKSDKTDKTDKADGQGGQGSNRDRGGQHDGGRGGNRGQGGQRNRGDQQQPEAGNRKRRRRGRDRDRDRPEEPWEGEPVDVEGYLDLRDEGYGFLRTRGYLPSKEDVYVSVKQVRQFALRRGDNLKGGSRPAGRNEKNPMLLRLDSVNGVDPEKAKDRPRFEDLTPLFPDEKLRLERDDDPGNMTARIVDLISPIGKGQRGLIVSPPKAGKTTIMKEIARSIEVNHPEVKVMVLLVDERPEEVTDMRRWLLRGEVVASTFDRPSDEHTAVAELTIERAKRMVERGEDVVIILDGITRLARAYNLAAPATGRIMSGGVDSGALYPPKRFFGAARNVEEGGSLTILATALVETGSKMDEVIFEEFKGTGNMELRLDRKTAERRIYPAIDVDASSTRHEELLFERKELQQVWKLRRVLSGLASDGNGGGAAGLELLIDRLKTFANNNEFLSEVAKGPVGA